MLALSYSGEHLVRAALFPHCNYLLSSFLPPQRFCGVHVSVLVLFVHRHPSLSSLPEFAVGAGFVCRYMVLFRFHWDGCIG